MSSNVKWQLSPLSRDRLDCIADQLAELIGNCEEPNPFYGPTMLGYACQFLLEDGDYFLFECWRDDCLIGVLPLEMACKFGRFSVSHLQTLSWRHGYLAIPIIRHGKVGVFCDALLGWLDEGRHDSNFLCLKLQHREGVFAENFQRKLQSSKRIWRVVQSWERAALWLKETRYEAYFQAVTSASGRKKIRSKIRKLEDFGVLNFEQFEPSGDIDQWLEDFLALEHAGWKGQEGTSIRSDPADEAFWKMYIKRSNEEDKLVFSRLTHNGKTIATSMDIHDLNTLFTLKIAHHPDYGKFSPGVLLEQENMRAAFSNQNIEVIDSCATADHPVLDTMMPGRRTIDYYIIAKKGVRSEGLARMMLGIGDLYTKIRGKDRNQRV